MKKSIGFILVMVALFLAAGCVTEKKKGGEVGWFKRGYHNLTSRYNYWFNADELFYLTLDKLETEHQDNYNQILDIYPYAAVDPNRHAMILTTSSIKPHEVSPCIGPVIGWTIATHLSGRRST